MWRHLIFLLLSTLLLSAFYLFLPLFGFIAVDLPKDEFWIKFLSNLGHIPGTTIALITGAIGAFFQGLFEITSSDNKDSDSGKNADNKDVYFVIKPIAGSIAGVILFFILSSGLVNIALGDDSAINYVKPGDVPLLGYLFWKMRPLTSMDLSKLIVYSFIAGFYYRLIPDLLDKMRGNILGKKSDKI